MTKKELVAAIAKTTGLTVDVAGSAVDAAIAHIAAELKGGGEVKITGLATFTCFRQEPRIARNPRTGGEVKVPAKWAVKIKPGKALTDAVQDVAVTA